MVGYLLLFQAFLIFKVTARPHRSDIFKEIIENDANLDPGFDLDGYRLKQLKLHNHYRGLHGVPTMTLSSTLNEQAQAYAESLASSNTGLNHCNLPTCDRFGAGENLAYANSSTSIEYNATESWYNEIWDYDFCSTNTSVKRPGHENKMIGHFTQVVWKASTQLGIGYARTSDGTGNFVVARYMSAGNVQGGTQYADNVLKPSYIFNTYQNNCNGIDGGLSDWSAAGECSRSCGGGVEFKTRTCTNPKPSLNGRDCSGVTKEIAVREWCNIQSCSSSTGHRDEQCAARGLTAKAHNFGRSNDCKLHCLQNGATYMHAGNVDDGTHCNSNSGACVAGVCQSMPEYVAPTEAPPTSATGKIIGGYTGVPSSNIWDNIIFEVPDGATDVTITNKKYNKVEIVTGYKSSTRLGYNWAESSWMNSWVEAFGSYTTSYTTVGVTFQYERKSSLSTIKIPGPVQPDSGYKFVLFARNTNQADISWSYNAP